MHLDTIGLPLQAVFFFLSLRKITWLNSQMPNLEDVVSTLNVEAENQILNCF